MFKIRKYKHKTHLKNNEYKSKNGEECLSWKFWWGVSSTTQKNPQELQGSKIDELIFWVPFEFDLNLDEHRWTILRKDK